MSDYEKLAIIFSSISISISFLVLGWNIYRDVILKPRLKVSLQLSFIMHDDYESPTKISITATNFGPNKIICAGIVAKIAPFWRRLFRKVKYAIIMHDYTDSYSSKLPRELDVGQECQLFLSFNKECFLSDPFTHVGIRDTFGRVHYAPKKDVAKARKEYLGQFAQNQSS
jgi:hypothetical protein